MGILTKMPVQRHLNLLLSMQRSNSSTPSSFQISESRHSGEESNSILVFINSFSVSIMFLYLIIHVKCTTQSHLHCSASRLRASTRIIRPFHFKIVTKKPRWWHMVPLETRPVYLAVCWVLVQSSAYPWLRV